MSAQGALALERGVLFVASGALRAELASFDLDGHRLGPSLALSAKGRALRPLACLTADSDLRVWVAESCSEQVLGFNLFGQQHGEVPCSQAGTAPLAQLRGLCLERRAVAQGEAGLWVARGGVGLRAVRLLSADGAVLHELRSLGDPRAEFRAVGRLAAAGERLLLAETGAARVQVFQRGEFHFAFQLRERSEALVPRALAALEDGRMLVLWDGARGGAALHDPAGSLLRWLARPAVGRPAEPGELEEASDLVVEDWQGERQTRVAVLDQDGCRVQVLRLEGPALGAFLPLAPEQSSAYLQGGE